MSLIVLGTFLRGPNWNFFGPFEFWDLHKLEALDQRQPVRVHLGEGARHRPAVAMVRARDLRHPVGADSTSSRCPGLLAKLWFKSYYEKLGAPRYYVTAFLFVTMMALPIKMLLRWVFNLKYIVAIPEFFFNI